MAMKKSKVKAGKQENNEKLSKKEIKKQERYVAFALIGMVFAIAALIAFVYFYNHSSDFRYKGLKFSRINQEGLTLYLANIDLKKAEGNFRLPVYLRHDPRSLEYIPSNISVLLRAGTYVAIDPNLSSCYGSNLGPYELGTVLGALGLRVKGATISEEFALENNVPRITCEDNYAGTTIVMQKSNQSRILQDDNCYVLNIKDCQITEVTERFIVEMLSDLLERSKEKLNQSGL